MRQYILSVILMLFASHITAQECFDYSTLGHGGLNSLVLPFNTGRMLAVEGNRGCLVSNDSNLHVLNMDNPSGPLLAGNISVGAKIELIKIFEGIAYISTGDFRLIVISLHDVGSPIILNESNYQESIRDFSVCESRLVVLAGNQVILYNISQESHTLEPIQLFEVDSLHRVKLAEDYCAVLTQTCSWFGDDYGHAVRSCAEYLLIVDMNGEAPYAITGPMRIEGSEFVSGPEIFDNNMQLMECKSTCIYYNMYDCRTSAYGYAYNYDMSDPIAPSLINRFSKDYSPQTARSENGLMFQFRSDYLEAYDCSERGGERLVNRFYVGIERDWEIGYSSGYVYMLKKVGASAIHVFDSAVLANSPISDDVVTDYDWKLKSEATCLDEKLAPRRYHGLKLGAETVLYSCRGESVLYRIDDSGRFVDTGVHLRGYEPEYGNERLLVYTRSVGGVNYSGIMNWRDAEILYETSDHVPWSGSTRSVLIGDNIVCTDVDSTYVYKIDNSGVLVKSWSMGLSLGALYENYVQNNGYLYHVDWENQFSSIWIVDDEDRLVPAGDLDGDIYGTSQYNLKIIGNTLCIVDVYRKSSILYSLVNPNDPERICQSVIPNAMNAVIVGNIAYSYTKSYYYMYDYNSAIYIHDVSDIANPIRLGAVSHYNGLDDLKYVDGHIVAFSYIGNRLTSYMLNCDIPTPNTLSGWDVQPSGVGTVMAHWCVNANPGDIRLSAHMGNSSRVVPHTYSSDNCFEAVDDLAAVSKTDYEIKYLLENLQDGVWVNLASKTLNIQNSTFRFERATPNPFNPSTELSYVLSRPGIVRLAIYDVSGRLVRELMNEPQGTGPQTVEWNGRGEGGRAAPAGCYFARLEACGRIETRKLTLVK